MKKNILLRTNLFVCLIIMVGFIITSFVSYHSNQEFFEKDVEQVSTLTMESVFHKIDTLFAKPINVSTTMANDSLLVNLLDEESSRMEDDSYVEEIQNYLNTYRNTYDYDSVFLVSANTNRYYNFEGIQRVLVKGEEENRWYEKFLNSTENYSINIDNDEASENEITVFVNCRIRDENNQTIGIVGVGFRIDSLQMLFQQYEKEFDVSMYLVDASGNIQVSSKETGYHSRDLFETGHFAKLKQDIISNQSDMGTFWYEGDEGKCYLVSQYIDHMNWYLIIDHDSSALQESLHDQLIAGIAIIMIVILLVLIIITRIIKKYNKKVISLVLEKEKEHRDVFQEATEQLYENIYELDVTHNCAASEETQAYFEGLGVPIGTPYDESLQIVAKKQIKEEFREGYLETFCPKHVLEVYAKGQQTLVYDFMITNDGSHYYWMRITARIFTWKEDKSVRMFTYRQNIDAQKSQEKKMMESLQRDGLSTLYNKAFTQDLIQQQLLKDTKGLYAFYILDIDDFKHVNDRFGHAIGDKVIAEFAQLLKGLFSSHDIVGRIGGDEFVAFVQIPNEDWALQKVKQLIKVLHHTYTDGSIHIMISASIGVCIAPRDGMEFDTLYRNGDKALYQAKMMGKHTYQYYKK